MSIMFKMNDFFGRMTEFVEIVLLGKVSLLSSWVERLVLWVMVGMEIGKGL